MPRTSKTAKQDGGEKDITAVESIFEYANNASTNPVVDRFANVVRGVKILGMKSKNGREYSASCIASAIPLYEGSASFVNHAKRGEGRDYEDRIGTMSNVRPASDGDGLVADFHYNPKSDVIEQFLWDCENAPGNAGFSHDVEGKTSRKDGKVIVEEITSVSSVDLVAKPATTKTIFESEELPGDGGHREFAEHGLSAVSDARSILLGTESVEEKKARLLETLSVWQSELAGGTVTHKESTMDWKDITRESLVENRKELVDEIVGDLSKQLTEANEKLAAATAKLAEIEAEKEKVAKTLAISEELAAAKLDATDKVAVSEAFMETLNAAPNAESRKRLIEDRVAILAPKRNGVAPLANLGGGITGPAKTKQEFLSRI